LDEKTNEKERKERRTIKTSSPLRLCPLADVLSTAAMVFLFIFNRFFMNKINFCETPRHAPTDEVWLRVAPLMDALPGRRGRPPKDNRQFLHAVLWMAKTGAPWRDLPPSLGFWRSVLADF